MKSRPFPWHCTLLLSLANPLWADSAERPVLEEVIVTSQKREQNVQDIPITIDVVDGEKLAQLNIRTTPDLANYVPGLSIQPAPHNLSSVTIRGVGTQAGSETYDQSVGLFIDGIYAGRQREFQASLFDIERVEVIKGSQASILGKNTSLGAISLITAKPGERLGGFVMGDYEFEFGSYNATGALDIPIPWGGLRLALNHVQMEPFVENTTTGNDVPTRTQTSGRLTGLFHLGDNGSLIVGYEHDDLEIQGDTFQITRDDAGLITGDSVPLLGGGPGLDPGADVGLDFVKSAYTSLGGDGESIDDQTTDRAYLKYEQGIGDYSFTALSGWSRYDNQRTIDSDFTSGDYLNTSSEGDFRQFTQELRFTSPAGTRFDYLVGLFYLNSNLKLIEGTDANFRGVNIILLPIELDGGSQKEYQQDTRVYSVFGQGTWSITERFGSTVGLRYTREEKDATFASVEARPGPAVGILRPLFPATDLSRTENNLDGSISFQYYFSDAAMTYLSWAKGTKSGGFSTEVDAPEDAEYDTEEARTTELGVKSVLLGGALTFNSALFYTKLDDFQVTRFNGVGFDISTIPASTRGIEFDSVWLASEAVLVNAAATYADATNDETDTQLNHAPKWSASVGAQYRRQLASSQLQLILRGDLNYIGKRYAQLNEAFPVDALTLLDVRLALANLAESWEVALLGRNLLNSEASFQFDYPFFGQFVPGTTEVGSINRPRTIALQLRYNF